MLLILMTVLTLGQSSDSSAIAQELERFEQRLATTWKHGDCTGWGAMLAPDWSVIHITGDIISKPQALEMCNAPRPPIDTFTIEDVSVRSFGDAAVVTGRTTMRAGGAKPETIVLRFTDSSSVGQAAGRWWHPTPHDSCREVPRF